MFQFRNTPTSVGPRCRAAVALSKRKGLWKFLARSLDEQQLVPTGCLHKL